MKGPVLLDAGPLVALLHRREHHHPWAVHRFAHLEPPLLTCEAVLTEAAFLVRSIPDGPQSLLALLKRRVVSAPFRLDEEHASVAELMARYDNVPMSLADACLVRMAELHPGSSVLTLNSDFRIYRKNRRQPIPLLIPDDR